MVGKLATRDLAVCALFGALVFAGAYLLGTGIIALTGIPATGSLLNMAYSLMVIIVGIKAVNKFGAATLILLVESALAIPTTIFGPPGMYKLAIALLVALPLDFLLEASKRSNISLYFAGAAGAALNTLLVWAFLSFLGLPGAEQLGAVLLPLAAASAILGLVGAYIGVWLFDNKLKKRAFIRQMGG
ncbi:MAG: hypothetical protein JW727_05485 [Candidatus Aenigmarchaeota archaeon]|nr:hypothetical protein [Candidatus Aenigmarchaeota archaeon]